MVTEIEIRAWALGVGFPPELGLCLGQVYANEHDGQLPSLEQLCEWGTSTGRRHPDGTWTCTDLPTKRVEELLDTKLVAWAKSQPLPLVVGGIAVLAWLMFAPKRRRR